MGFFGLGWGLEGFSGGGVHDGGELMWSIRVEDGPSMGLEGGEGLEISWSHSGTGGGSLTGGGIYLCTE